MKKFDFKDRVIIVTGAGQGLGRAYALELARLGASVVVNDLGTVSAPSADAESVVSEITENGGKAIAACADVASPQDVAAVVEKSIEHFGKIDGLINNAGNLRDSSFAKMTLDDFKAVINVHLLGSFNMARAVFPHMIEKGYGRIVFTTSAAGLFGNFGQANYAAAKMGIVGLSNVVGIEGKKAGITSNVIAPGAATQMTIPLGLNSEIAPAEAVAPLVAYLVSEQCTASHNIYSAAAGRYARTFIGAAKGWKPSADQGLPTIEDIAENFDQIHSIDGFKIFENAQEEGALMFS